MDVSFISATLVLPAVVAAVRGDTVRDGETLEAVILVKPQFEAGREHIGKGGIVTSSVGHRLAIDRVRSAVQELGGNSAEVIDSPIDGAKGNREFLLYSRF